jgi:flagellar hook-length control protein FliK
MINTNDLGKIAFFPEKDHKKIDNQNPFFSDSGSFLTALQTVSEETREITNSRENQFETESHSPTNLKNEIQVSEKMQDEIPENAGIPQNSEPIDVNDSEELVLLEHKDGKESLKDLNDTTSAQTKSEIGKEEKTTNKLGEIQNPANGYGIISMLMPSFQREANGMEIFQEKLKNGMNPHSQTTKDLFPKKSDFKETGDLLKNVFDSQNKNSIEKGFASKERSTQDPKTPKEPQSVSSQNVKQILEDLKMQSSKSTRGEEKGNENSKTILSASFLELLDSDGINEKKLKSIKKKTDDLKSSGVPEKKGNEAISSEKISNKDSVFLSRNSKEENQPTTITEKLKRTEMNIRRDRNSEPVIDLKMEGHTEQKSTEKSSPSNLIFDAKQKTNESKIEVKSLQKQDSLSQNFKEIVKAAKFHIVENGKNTAEISLQPKDLGKVTLFVSEENNRMEGRITVENESTRQMILGELANLKADLKEGGLDLFEIHVDLQQEANQPFAKGEDSENRRSTESSSEYTKASILEEDSQDLDLDLPTSRLLDLKV